MGNCMVMQEKAIKVMKTDGEILEYGAPMKVHQVLSEYTGHAISETLPGIRLLQPDADMLPDHLYYLLPLPAPSLEFEKKTLRYSNSREVAGEKNSGVSRIKLVISKQELEVMLTKGGVSVKDMVCHLKKQSARVNKLDNDVHGNCKRWKPVLTSIPEVN